MSKSISLILAIAVLALVLSGCEQRGPRGIKVGESRAETDAKTACMKPAGGTHDDPILDDTLVDMGFADINSSAPPPWRMVTDRHTLHFSNGVLVGWSTQWDVQ